MNKVTLLIGIALLTASSAHASCGDDGTLAGNDCLLMSSFLTTLAPTIAPLGTTAQNRIVYVNVVREDAAEFVAANGQAQASAMLQDVMNQARQENLDAAQLSDLNLAKLVATSFN